MRSAKKRVGERYTLKLLGQYLAANWIARIEQITPAIIDGFFASRPHNSARSFNAMLRNVTCLFKWLVVHGILAGSPATAKRRRIVLQRPFLFDRADAARLLAVAKHLPALLFGTMRRLMMSGRLDLTQRRKQLGCGDLADRPLTDTRKDHLEQPPRLCMVTVAEVFARSSSHSRAMTSNVSTWDCWSLLRRALGSTPSASSRRASSRFSRAR